MKIVTRAIVTVLSMCLASALAAAILRGQSGVSRPVFEVASIKQNKSNDVRSTIGFERGGRFRAYNESLVRLIGEAYATAFSLPPQQILGGPDWINVERWDVDAVTRGDPSREEQHLMLQALLADRFKLAAHAESRELPVYNLVPARTDGRLGEKLHRSQIDCAALDASGAARPPASSGIPPCVFGFAAGRIAGIGMTMTQLAEGQLSRVADRPVVDHTDLSGAYDWDLVYQPTQGLGDPGGPAVAPGADRTSIFTAIQEQLGLKLDTARGPVGVVVIDHVERPTPD